MNVTIPRDESCRQKNSASSSLDWLMSSDQLHHCQGLAALGSMACLEVARRPTHLKDLFWRKGLSNRPILGVCPKMGLHILKAEMVGSLFLMSWASQRLRRE